jgi:hypothetical protein
VFSVSERSQRGKFGLENAIHKIITISLGKDESWSPRRRLKMQEKRHLVFLAPTDGAKEKRLQTHPVALCRRNLEKSTSNSVL